MYYLSVDGGGSKTAFLITDEMGHTMVETISDGCSYPQIGIDGVARVISTELECLLDKTGLRRSDIKGAVFGLPCYGEDREADRELERIVLKAVGLSEAYVHNDVELGWAGSLGLSSGIHVVAGTGAIAYGRDIEGNSCRSNGWHEDFSDEGSGYWLGMQALSLFSKQSDGRAEKSFLYKRMKEVLGIADVDELVPLYVAEYRGNRKKIAALQKVLLEAAKEGDASAVILYHEAAAELADSIRAVASNLYFGENIPIPVSYSGGVFFAGEFIMKSLKDRLDGGLFDVREPLLKPVQGGILLAAGHMVPDAVQSIRSVLVGSST